VKTNEEVKGEIKWRSERWRQMKKWKVVHKKGAVALKN